MRYPVDGNIAFDFFTALHLPSSTLFVREQDSASTSYSIYIYTQEKKKKKTGYIYIYIYE